MKLVVTTDDDRIIATFENAESMDYIDYSADLDDAMAEAIGAEGRPCPDWLRKPNDRE